MAFNEVVVTLVALGGGPEGAPPLRVRARGRRPSAVLAVMAFTPLSGIWFGEVQRIPAELIPMARLGAALCLLMPAYQVAQSWFQGLLVHAHQTRPITEAVLIYFALAWGLLELGVLRARRPRRLGPELGAGHLRHRGAGADRVALVRSRGASRALG